MVIAEALTLSPTVSGSISASPWPARAGGSQPLTSHVLPLVPNQAEAPQPSATLSPASAEARMDSPPVQTNCETTGACETRAPPKARVPVTTMTLSGTRALGAEAGPVVHGADSGVAPGGVEGDAASASGRGPPLRSPEAFMQMLNETCVALVRSAHVLRRSPEEAKASKRAHQDALDRDYEWMRDTFANGTEMDRDCYYRYGHCSRYGRPVLPTTAPVRDPRTRRIASWAPASDRPAAAAQPAPLDPNCGKCVCGRGRHGPHCEQLRLAPQRTTFDGLGGNGTNYWGASPIRDEDGKYHLFASELRGGGLYTWFLTSVVVHAVSSSPTGPYAVVDTALEGSGGTAFDGTTVHNPHIVRLRSGMGCLHASRPPCSLLRAVCLPLCRPPDPSSASGPCRRTGTFPVMTAPVTGVGQPNCVRSLPGPAGSWPCMVALHVQSQSSKCDISVLPPHRPKRPVGWLRMGRTFCFLGSGKSHLLANACLDETWCFSDISVFVSFAGSSISGYRCFHHMVTS